VARKDSDGRGIAAQAKNLAGALAQGDPARGQIIRQAVKGKLQEFVNR
jgi:hypothetical protein